MNGRRRWVLQSRDGGEPGRALVVEAGRDAVTVAIGAERVQLRPWDVARLRKVLLDAMAAVIWERGTW